MKKQFLLAMELSTKVLDFLEPHKNMYQVTKHQLNVLSQEAVKSRRKRAFFRLHNYIDPVLKLLNALEPQTYIQPHKHFLKDHQELFIALRGKLVVLLFDKKGTVTNNVFIGPKEETIIFEVPQNVWHTIWSMEEGSVVMEVIKGPYNKATFKEFAPWAPSENDPAAEKYKENTLEKFNLH